MTWQRGGQKLPTLQQNRRRRTRVQTLQMDKGSHKNFQKYRKKWDKDVKPKNRLERPLIGTRTSAWPMNNRQSQTLAWMIWKIRKIKEHGGEEAEERKEWGEVARKIYGQCYQEQKNMEERRGDESGL